MAAQLSDADRMLEIYQNMLPAWEATKETDRHYTLRKQGIEAMRAYLDGTYSVFGLEKTLQTPTTEAVSERPAAEPEVSEPEPPTAEAETSEIEPALPAEEKAVLTAPQLKRERVRFAPLYPEIPAGQRHDFHITDRELGVGSKAESMRPMWRRSALCKQRKAKTGWRRRRSRRSFPVMWAGAALPIASMKSTAGMPS